MRLNHVFNIDLEKTWQMGIKNDCSQGIFDNVYFRVCIPIKDETKNHLTIFMKNYNYD